jgi:hypothetical protein
MKTPIGARLILAFTFFVAWLLVTTGCGGGGSGNGGTPGSPTLASLTIAPANPTIATGQNQQFTAQGTFSDGSHKDLTNSVGWTSSNPDVATISTSGMATAVAKGGSAIGAVSGSVNTSTTLTVGVPNLASIAVFPANAAIVVGAPVHFTATGTLTSGSVQDVTQAVVWSSSDTGVTTVDTKGQASGVGAGTATISAASGTVIGSAQVTVSVSTGLPKGIGWNALPSNTILEASGACPPNNFGGDPFQFAALCGNVIRSWSGAIADTTANRLLIWGGGHTNYYGNEIYSLNLSENPVTLTRLKDPTVPTNFANSANCVDGLPPGNPDFAPNSRSSYGGLAFLPRLYQMYSEGGVLACQLGDGSQNTWTIPLNSLSNASSWAHENPTLTGPVPGTNGGSGTGNVADYDPNSGLVFLSDTAAIYSYNFQTNTYALVSPAQGFVTSIYLSGAIDPTRKLFVLAGNCPGGTCTSGNGVFVADISNPAATRQQDWTATTMADATCAEFLGGGVTPIGAANPGITFDSVANDFVGWPNQGDSVYILTPDKVNMRLTCVKQTFANGPPNSAHGTAGANTTNGTFGRFRYFPGLDVFVVVNDWNIPAYVLRLR